MNKEEYLLKAFKEIRDKNLKTPFQIKPGIIVPDLESYLIGLEKSYLNVRPPQDQLFFEKIEELRKFKQ